MVKITFCKATDLIHGDRAGDIVYLTASEQLICRGAHRASGSFLQRRRGTACEHTKYVQWSEAKRCGLRRSPFAGMRNLSNMQPKVLSVLSLVPQAQGKSEPQTLTAFVFGNPPRTKETPIESFAACGRRLGTLSQDPARFLKTSTKHPWVCANTVHLNKRNQANAKRTQANG